MREGAPIRFLFVVLGGWTCLRIGMLAPGWWSADPAAAVISREPEEQPAAPAPHPSDPAARVTADSDEPEPWHLPLHTDRLVLAGSPASTLAPGIQTPSLPAPSTAAPSGAAAPVQAALGQPAFAEQTHLSSRRWSASAWLLARGEGGTTLAPGGTLGGSQAGTRLLYRLNDDAGQPLSLSARIYAPLRRMQESEAAVGLDWRPSAGLPIHLLIERRVRLGSEGRSAFSATIYGGGSVDLGHGWRIDGYAQAGIVGTRSRDAFVDGSARIARPMGPIETGAAVWGAAQPGASRVDAGPQLTLPIRTRSAALRLSAEYRFRLAGDALPPSGPVLTLGVDF